MELMFLGFSNRFYMVLDDHETYFFLCKPIFINQKKFGSKPTRPVQPESVLTLADLGIKLNLIVFNEN